KSKIKQFFKKQRKAENIEKGKTEVENGIKELGFPLKDVLTTKNIKRECEKFNFINEEDLCVGVGYQRISGALIVTRLTDKLRKQQENEQNLEEKIIEAQQSVQDTFHTDNKSDSGVIVAGMDNMLVRLSRCCNPVPY